MTTYTHKMPTHEWGAGFSTKYEPSSKMHRVYKDGKAVGVTFLRIFDWTFWPEGGGEGFNAGNLPGIMALLTSGTHKV